MGKFLKAAGIDGRFVLRLLRRVSYHKYILGRGGVERLSLIRRQFKKIHLVLLGGGLRLRRQRKEIDRFLAFLRFLRSRAVYLFLIFIIHIHCG